MIDPIHSLAFSIQANRGVYAVLVGSGVSRAANIPTGWEITLDLIRKLVKLHEETGAPTQNNGIGRSSNRKRITLTFYMQSPRHRPSDSSYFARILNQATKSARRVRKSLRRRIAPSRRWLHKDS